MLSVKITHVNYILEFHELIKPYITKKIIKTEIFTQMHTKDNNSNVYCNHNKLMKTLMAMQ